MTNCEVVVLSATTAEHFEFSDAIPEPGLCFVLVAFNRFKFPQGCVSESEHVRRCGHWLVVKEKWKKASYFKFRSEYLNIQVLKTLVPLFFPYANIVGWIDDEKRSVFTLDDVRQLFKNHKTMVAVPEHHNGPQMLGSEIVSRVRKGFFPKSLKNNLKEVFESSGWNKLPLFDTTLRFQRNVPPTQKFSCDWFERIEAGFKRGDELYLTPALYENELGTPPSLKVISVDESKKFHRSVDTSFKTAQDRCPYLPTHVLLGPQKSGTSTVYEMLKHCMPLCYDEKELHLFDGMNHEPTEKLMCQKYYKRTSTNAKHNCLAIEITPSNAMESSAAKFFARTKPKIHGLFRDPVDRVVSAMNMGCCVGRSLEDLNSTLDRDIEQLTETFKAHPNAHEFGTRHGSNNWGLLPKSIYDVTFEMYPEVRDRFWDFDLLVNNCEDFVRELAKFVERPDALGCLLNQCKKDIHVRPKCSAKSQNCMERSEMREDVVEFIKKHNHVWYQDHVRDGKRHKKKH